MKEANLLQPALTLRLMKWAGRYYLLLVIAFARVTGGSLGIFLSNIMSRNNSNLTPEQSNTIYWVNFLLLLVGDLVVLGVMASLNREMMTRLEQWKHGNKMSEGRVELRAWQQANTFTWNYSLTGIAIAVLVNTLPLLIFQSVSLQTNTNQLLYSAFGAGMAAIITLTTSVIIIETLMHPARLILLPTSFEFQIKGAVGARLRTKVILSTLAVVMVSVLALAPLGYSRTYRVIYETIGSLSTLQELQTSMIAVTMIVLALGGAIAFFNAETSAAPIRELVQVFRNVERGDLKQRARVIATDETGELAIYFNRMIARIEELQLNLEKRVQEQTEKLRASNEVGRIASTIRDPDELISRVVNLITKTFDYYYVAIFLVSSNGRWAEIVDATGSAGEILKARRHRLQVGGTSMVGSAIATGQAQIAMDVGEAAVRFNNPLLPNTRSELALPLIAGERVIGALDVQSVREADFKPDDITTLQSLASQVAIAIENARLFREMEDALAELRQTNRQYILSAWQEQLQAGKLEYIVKAPDVSEAKETREISVNLSVREQPIGYIRLETSGEWTEEDQAWVESLATQVAIALENARLVEDSNQAATRERLSASIIQRLWSSQSVDGILQTAVRELGRALEASEAAIELKLEK